MLQFVDYEVRAGLSTSYNVEGKGWVADDLHSESASRTLRVRLALLTTHVSLLPKTYSSILICIR